MYIQIFLQKQYPGRLRWTLDMHPRKEDTLPKTNSSPLKIGHPKRKGSSSNDPFSGAFAVNFREGIRFFLKHLGCQIPF